MSNTLKWYQSEAPGICDYILDICWYSETSATPLNSPLNVSGIKVVKHEHQLFLDDISASQPAIVLVYTQVCNS